MSEQIANTVMIPADQLRPIADELKALRAEIERLRAENDRLSDRFLFTDEQITSVARAFWRCTKNSNASAPRSNRQHPMLKN